MFARLFFFVNDVLRQIVVVLRHFAKKPKFLLDMRNKLVLRSGCLVIDSVCNGFSQMAHTNDNYYEYLPVSKSNMEWDLYMTGAGVADIAPGEKYPPLGHPGTYDFKWETGRVLPEYQIVFISSGEGSFESVEMGRIDIKEGDAILLFPGRWHRYRPNRDAGWKEHWISWNGEYLYRLARRKIITHERAVLSIESTETILALHERILDLVREHPGENSRVMAAIGMEILATIIESAGEKPLQRAARRLQQKHGIEDEVVAEAMHLIWSHSYRARSIDALVERLPVTRRTLERRFRNALGRSVGQEVIRCRIQRAKHMLSNTNVPIEHVAFAVGFSGVGRLGKAFQQSEKTTPSAYRKRLNKG